MDDGAGGDDGAQLSMEFLRKYCVYIENLRQESIDLRINFSFGKST